MAKKGRKALLTTEKGHRCNEYSRAIKAIGGIDVVKNLVEIGEQTLDSLKPLGGLDGAKAAIEAIEKVNSG
jgi:hypothetical protein